MIEIVGKYNVARVYTDNIEHAAYAQVLNLMKYKDSIEMFNPLKFNPLLVEI